MKVQIGGERDLHYGQPLTTEDTSQWINTASSIPFQDALYIVSQKVSSKMAVFFSFILTFTGLHSCSLRIVLKINYFCINLALHKWPLGSNTMNKASGGDGIPVELFQILKDDAVKVLYSICQQIWKTQQRPQDWKRSFFIPIPKKGNAKESSSYCTIAFISHNSKVNFLMFKLVLEKAEEPEIKLPTSIGSLKKQDSSRTTSTSALLIMPKPSCGSQQTVENS